jgi:SAM-dependent methyltransferase
LGDAPSDYYDFIMSTIALQHIPVYVVRRKILEHMARTLKKGGILSIQMGYGEIHPNADTYYTNAFYATTTNSGHDVKVTDPNQLIKDFEEIGLSDIKTVIRPSFSDGHQYWIFAQGTK